MLLKHGTEGVNCVRRRHKRINEVLATSYLLVVPCKIRGRKYLDLEEPLLGVANQEERNEENCVHFLRLEARSDGYVANVSLEAVQNLLRSLGLFFDGFHASQQAPRASTYSSQ